MSRKALLSLLNPVHWLRAYAFQRQQPRFDKAAGDLELQFYAQIFKNGMLHYGYFDDPHVAPESVSLQALEDAQVAYAHQIIDLIADREGRVLDVGCGMGGLAAMLRARNFAVEALTPNGGQKRHFDTQYPAIPCHWTTFEDFHSDHRFGTIINSESLQYIDLAGAFRGVDRLLAPGGRWIVADYFRRAPSRKRRSGHVYDDFAARVEANGWKTIVHRDITDHVLPTLKVVTMYADRFLRPLEDFAFEKLRRRRAWLYYLTRDLRGALQVKLQKELGSVHPETFAREKRYLLMVLTR